MTSPEMAFPSPLAGRRDRLWPLVLASLAVHGAAVTFAAIERPTPPVDLSQKPMMAHLVRLGPKRPSELLPVKEPAAAAPAPSPVAVPVPGLPPEPAEKKQPSDRTAPAKPGQKRDALAGVLSRMEHEQASDRPLYGDPNGDPEGTSSEGAEGNRYLGLVHQVLQDNFHPPATISKEELARLKGLVILYIEPNGSVSRFTWTQRSGNPQFDNAAERAIHDARLPPPPPEMREQLRRVGQGYRFQKEK